MFVLDPLSKVYTVIARFTNGYICKKVESKLSHNQSKGLCGPKGDGLSESESSETDLTPIGRRA